MNLVESLLTLVNEFIQLHEIADAIGKITTKNDKYGLINNSFMFREGVKTVKNSKYLAFFLDTIPVTKDSCFIIEGFELKNDFKAISRADDKIKKLQPIEDAIREESETFGDIVFILMGQIDDEVKLSCEIEGTTYSQLVFNPQSSEDVILDSGKIICRSIEDEGTLWSEIERQLNLSTTPPGEIATLKEKLGTPISKLKEQIFLNLIIPERFDSKTKYFLELISDSIREQIDYYKSALINLNSATSNRGQALNEILRMSYNFVEASDTILRLIISVCDLKPLLLWLTFVMHVRLTDTIRSLPWKKQDTKASMKMYASTVKNARNKTFHSLIPFPKSFKVKLPENAIKDANLRIFSEFGTKNNRLEYKDKELVDVLMEFTRTSEEVVSGGFWEKNLQVIERTCDVLDSTAVALRAIRG